MTTKIKRTIFCGDVHACLLEFEELLKTIQYNSNTDRIILLGDTIDRGPYSVEVIRKCREMNLECVRGNHEQKFLNFLKGNKYLDKHDHYLKFSDEDVQYINNMPYSIKIRDDLWAVHAGVKPGIPLEKQSKDDLLYLRYIDKDRKFISLRKMAKDKEIADKAIFWTEFGPFGADVIYGHNVHSMTDIKIDKQEDGFSCYGIDTGACFGGKLTALIWETKEIVQVQAKKIYYKSGF